MKAAFEEELRLMQENKESDPSIRNSKDQFFFSPNKLSNNKKTSSYTDSDERWQGPANECQEVVAEINIKDIKKT